jgi:hypothetical protein
MTSLTDIAAINRFLALGELNFPALTDGQWQDLFDELHLLIFRQPRIRDADDDFNFYLVTHDPNRPDHHPRADAQRALLKIYREVIPALKACNGISIEFPIEEEIVQLTCRSGGFRTNYRYKKSIETAILRGFLLALEHSGVRPADFAVCSDPKCGRLFVPPRKPRAGKRSFCCPKHLNRVIQREHRDRQKEDVVARKRGQERSHRYYTQKVTAGRPNLKVARRPRR